MPVKGYFQKFCKRGHERIPENLFADGRSCRLCNAINHSKMTAAETWAANLRHLYKMTVEEFNFAFTEQQHKCAICGLLFGKEKKNKPHVDHDHGSKKFRALLCQNCNLMLGHAQDNIVVLENAIAYLIRHKNP